jgi:hypothetical protein
LLGGLLEFDQHAVRGRWVNERDEGALRAWPGSLVNEPDTVRAQFRDRRLDIFHAKRDVMQTGTAPLEVFGHGGVGAYSFEQLQCGFADRDEMRPYALRRDLLRGMDRQAEPVAVEGQRLIQSFDDDGDVIQYGFHWVRSRPHPLARGTRRPYCSMSSAAAEYGSISPAPMRSMVRLISPTGSARSSCCSN